MSMKARSTAVKGMLQSVYSQLIVTHSAECILRHNLTFPVFVAHLSASWSNGACPNVIKDIETIYFPCVY